MNFQNINFDHVEEPRPWPPHYPQGQTLISESDSHSTIQQRHLQRPGLASDDSQNSISPQATLRPRAPTPPSDSNSPSELYGPDRYQQVVPELASLRNSGLRPFPQERSVVPPTVRFDEAQLAMFAVDNANANRMAGIKDELAIAAGKVTPGIDDTPYIQYAIAALTGDQSGDDRMAAFRSGTATPATDFTPPRRSLHAETGPRAPAMPQAAYLDDREEGYREDFPEPVGDLQHTIPFTQQPQIQPPAPTNSAMNAVHNDADHWVPIAKDMRNEVDPNDRTYPPLTYKPRILRPFSMIILMTSCLLMIAGLVFSALYSDRNSGLTTFSGSIYSSQWFVFRLLPTLLSGIVLLYAQNVVTASIRILPFVALASEDPRKRYQALFQRLYSTSFLVPRFQGPWQFKLFSVATTLMCFSIPLSSAAFTLTWLNGVWSWAAVQGMVWTLVVLYAILSISTAVLMVFWFRQWTGLMWDIRSIGDLIPLLSRSNGMGSYGGLDAQSGSQAFKVQLRDRWFDRLGYWRTKDMQTSGIWYTIGSSSPHSMKDPQAVYDIMGKRASYDASLDSRDLITPGNVNEVRYRYLPWCLRDGAVAAWVAGAGVLLLALLIVAFLPTTRLEKGWLPLLSARPDGAAFSPANFLYSFLPSLIGTILFLLFQSLDNTLRVLQPWAELSKLNGSTARKSLLADYAACLPFQSSLRAVQNAHWRVAVTSFMSVLFIVLPVLGGGLFMALTDADGRVRMFPNMPVFGVLLAMLFSYLGCLSLLLPRRGQFMLPHPVSCLAEIISFCSADDLTRDAAFRAVRSRQDLEGRLGIGKGSKTGDAREESVWFFGIVPGRDEHKLSFLRSSVAFCAFDHFYCWR
ncbi:phosphoribosylaminoimidazole-succinocarboxamide synthase [Sarocladium implicatum]|nr:phosphoribosylaminoimidazole-succinocarboxamide synthase [Sarocladium implicatum]